MFKNTLTPIVLFCLLAMEMRAQTTTDDSQLFAFKFQTNQPLVYAFSIKTRTMTENNTGGKSSLANNTTDIRYRVRMTYYKNNPDGSTFVYFKPYRVAEDMDIVGPNHFVLQIRGLKIKNLQNNVVTIDTENNVGMSQVNQIKHGIYPVMLSGYFNFDPMGRTLKFEGDLPFIDYWTEMFKARLGYFSILFPNHRVGIQEAWTENYPMNTCGGAVLDSPLTFTNTFTRGLNLMTNGNPIASFDMTSANHLQNISGYIDQNGQKSSLNISQFNRDSFGTYHFDRKRGVLLDSKTTDTDDISIEMLVQGNSATSHYNIKTEMQINLITEPIEAQEK